MRAEDLTGGKWAETLKVFDFRSGIDYILVRLGGVYPFGLKSRKKGGVFMSTGKDKKMTLRDYSKPIIPVFRGEKGHRAYVEIATTPPTRYNAEVEKQKAAENLRRQGLIV